ncbi:hypothetical protein [Gilvimarinus sp. 1_MG-2023]|nr:hypothetical protein [Gilvimarinus sp. 1_MG-2023]MDO6746950.1 hypothetical protein [Gilvimarinus sp. 1_MG-2023]
MLSQIDSIDIQWYELTSSLLDAGRWTLDAGRWTLDMIMVGRVPH